MVWNAVADWQCAVDNCDMVINQNKKSWRINSLNHFLETHLDRLLNHMRYTVRVAQ